MYVIHHAHLSASDAGGAQCLAVAGPGCGIEGFQVWVHQLAPGAHSPPRRHHGELVAIALAGSGKVLVDGGPQRFQSPCTVLIPPRAEFEFVNNAAVPLQLVVVFSRAPEDLAAPASAD